ncbi:MAG TPA: hypothetical protein VL069_06280 [Opitutus sp.]|nr:hypothetical protein [Opitutus sp.]
MKLVSLILLSAVPLLPAAEIPSSEWQIKTAVLAAPEMERAGATVLGYNASGAVVTLRQGSNNFVCLADDPAQKGFSVACYHKDLEPFMARGRALTAEGKNAAEIFNIREAEVKSGKLPLPDKSILNVATGTVKDATGEVTDLYTRYVIYIPYATPESTGIPLTPVTDGAPWIMNPGTHRAHIMISPPKAPTAPKSTSSTEDHKNH